MYISNETKDDTPTWIKIKQIENKNSPDNDCITDIYERLLDGDIPKQEEVAMQHPFNTSTISILNNGMIKEFVATNVGRIIDPGAKTINDICNGLYQHIGYLNSFINDYAFMDIMNNLSIKVEKGPMWLYTLGNQDYHSDSNIRQYACGNIDTIAQCDITDKSINITLNAKSNINATANSNININADNNIKIYSSGNIDISADGNVNISGNYVNIN